MLVAIIVLIIFLSILILVHELGHFLAAKKFGLLVEEFGFGLPPRLWSKKIGETIYSLNALPFGGFVKIFGEDSSKDTDSHGLDADSRRLDAEQRGLDVDLQRQKSFLDLSISRRAVVIVSGVLMNFVLGWFVISIVFMVGISGGIVISEVEPQSPAEVIGLKSGDKILGIETPFQKLESDFTLGDVSKLIQDSAGNEIILKIERDGKSEYTKAVPRVKPPPGQGSLGVLLMDPGIPGLGFSSGLWAGLKTSIQITLAVFKAVIYLVAGVFNLDYGVFHSLTGPVGIVKISAEAGRLGFLNFLQFLSLISLNLAVLNILPFPALDGGRLLFLFFEKIKGSPLPQKFEKNANALGITILLALMAVITIKDIAGLF